MSFLQNKSKAEVFFLSHFISSKAASQASARKKDLEQVVLNVSFTEGTGEGTLLFPLLESRTARFQHHIMDSTTDLNVNI